MPLMLRWRGYVVERRACWNGRFSVQARLELANDPVDMSGHPGVQVRQGDWLALVRVGDQVDQAWGGQFRGRVLHVLLCDEDELEVPPLDAVDLWAHPVDIAFALRGVGSAGEPVELVDAVDDAVGGFAQPGRVQDRGEPVGGVHDVVAAPAARDVAGPADDARGAQVPFPAGEVGPLPVAGRTAPQHN